MKLGDVLDTAKFLENCYEMSQAGYIILMSESLQDRSTPALLEVADAGGDEECSYNPYLGVRDALAEDIMPIFDKTNVNAVEVATMTMGMAEVFKVTTNIGVRYIWLTDSEPCPISFGNSFPDELLPDELLVEGVDNLDDAIDKASDQMGFCISSAEGEQADTHSFKLTNINWDTTDEDRKEEEV